MLLRERKLQNSPDPYSPSVVPLVPRSESLVVSSLRDFTHVIILYMYEWLEAMHGSLFLLLPLPLWSALCLLHLITSQCLCHRQERKPRRPLQPDLFKSLSFPVRCLLVCVCVRAPVGDDESVNKEKRPKIILDIFNCMACLA